MSSTPPSYFEQPYEILGYRVVSYAPIEMDDRDLMTQLLTAPVYLHQTWESAWANALERVESRRLMPTYPVYICSTVLDAVLTNPTAMADIKHTADCGSPVIMTVNSGYPCYIVAISAVLGEERHYDDGLSEISDGEYDP